MSRIRTLAVGICLLGLLGLCFAVRADTEKKGPSASQEPLVDPECSVVDVVTLDNRVIDVQPGDVFYLTASGPQGEKGITVDLDDGSYGMVIRTGSRLPVSYNNPGTYMIHLDVTGEHVKPIKVRVIAPPKDLEEYNTPNRPSSSGITLMAANVPPPSIGGSVGSVYAGVYPDTKSKFPIRIVVTQGGRFTLTKYGGGWSQYWDFGAAGETNDVINGPTPGENSWTLIKSGGGTHVLSPNSPSKLKINRILMHSGPAYVAQPRADLTSSNIYLAVSTPLVLVVDPGPGWASNNTPRTDQLYEWKVNGASPGTFAVSNSFSFPTPGTYQVSVECKSPSTTPIIQSLTITVVGIDLTGFWPSGISSTGAPVSESDEDDPLKLFLGVNNDDDNGDGEIDNIHNVLSPVDPEDDELAALIVRQVAPSTLTGTLTLDLPPELRLFDSSGNVVTTPVTMDLSTPSGPLAGILTGDVKFYIEANAEADDAVVVLRWNQSSTGTYVEDKVHATLITVKVTCAVMMGSVRCVNAEVIEGRWFLGVRPFSATDPLALLVPVPEKLVPNPTATLQCVPAGGGTAISAVRVNQNYLAQLALEWNQDLLLWYGDTSFPYDEYVIAQALQNQSGVPATDLLVQGNASKYFWTDDIVAAGAYTLEFAAVGQDVTKIPLDIVSVAFSRSAVHKYGYDKYESMTVKYNNAGTIIDDWIGLAPDHDIICGKRQDDKDTFVRVDIAGCVPNKVFFTVTDPTIAKIGNPAADSAQVAALSADLKIWPQNVPKDWTTIRARFGSATGPEITSLETWTYEEHLPTLPYWHVVVNDVGANAAPVNVPHLISTAVPVFRQAVINCVGQILDKQTCLASYTNKKIKNDACDVFAIAIGEEVDEIIEQLKKLPPNGIGYKSDTDQNAVLIIHVKKVRQVYMVGTITYDAASGLTKLVPGTTFPDLTVGATLNLEGWNNAAGVPIVATPPRTIVSASVSEIKISGPQLSADFANGKTVVVGTPIGGIEIPKGVYDNMIIVGDQTSQDAYESYVLHEMGHTANLGRENGTILWQNLAPIKNLMYGADYTPPVGGGIPNGLRNRALPGYNPAEGVMEKQWDIVTRSPF